VHACACIRVTLALAQLLCDSTEFDELPVRHSEDELNKTVAMRVGACEICFVCRRACVRDVCWVGALRYKVPPIYDDPHVKVRCVM
jgi:hypothetical protein